MTQRDESDSRVAAYLGELMAQLDNARDHVDRMSEGVERSAAWERAEDQDWIRGAHEEARRAVRAAEKRLELGHAIAEKAAIL